MMSDQSLPLSVPLQVRLFAWWAGWIQGVGCGMVAVGVFTVRSPWVFLAAIALIVAGFVLDEKIGRYAKEATL